MKNFIFDNMPWIISIAVGAGAIITTTRIAEAKIDSLQLKYEQHCVKQQTELEILPVKLEFIQQQLSEIKESLKEIRIKLDSK